MICSYCSSYIKKRIYTFNASDDDDNLFCSNKSCVSNINNDVSIKNKLHKIKYCCQKCNRTLLHNNKIIFGNYNLTDYWLYLHEFGNDSYCNECENYVLSLNNYDICNICGIICKNNMCGNHNNIIFDNIDELNQTFIKNEKNEKCKYCHRYLMKCKICKNSCYVCVFSDCRKSQLNGLKLEYYSYLCKKHSVGVTNKWTDYKSNSNVVCENCGTNKTCYKPNCKCLGVNSISLCINCHDVDYAMYGLYCYYCQ